MKEAHLSSREMKLQVVSMEPICLDLRDRDKLEIEKTMVLDVGWPSKISVLLRKVPQKTER